jgi:hypothetical protein
MVDRGAARRSRPGSMPSLHRVAPSPPGPPPSAISSRAPLEKGIAPVAARFFSTLTVPPATPAPLLPSVSCRGIPPEAARDRRSRPSTETSPSQADPAAPPSCTASVRPRRSRLARHLPLFLRELSPPISPRLNARLDAAGRASPPPRGDHGRCARPTPRPSRPGRVAVGSRARPPCHRTRAGFARAP